MGATPNRRAVPEQPPHVAALEQARSNWGELALILIHAEKNEEWRTTHPSFTAFIRDTAKHLRVQDSVLWRTFSAGRFYESLGGAYDRVNLPPLSVAARSTSAERLELIEKIARVAPRNVVAELLERELAGELSRDRLREVWRAYRPATEGATARGAHLRGQVAGRRANAAPRPLVNRGSALYALLESSSQWTGEKNPTAYRAFPDPPLAIPLDTPAGISAPVKVSPDLIAVVQSDAYPDCQLHIVEFLSETALHSVRNLASRFRCWLPYADFIWAFVAKAPELVADEIPPHVGLLWVSKGRAVVFRPAVRHPKGGMKSGQTAKLLLTSLI